MKRWKISMTLMLMTVMVGCSSNPPRVVVITYAPDQENTPTPVAVSTSIPDAALDATASPAQHIVQWGDTLSQIAARYNVSLASLLAINNLENPDLLEVNQVINLPQAPSAYSSAFRALPDSKLIRSASAQQFNTEAFIRSQPGIIRALNFPVFTRQADGSPRTDTLTAAQIVERVSQEYSVDPRILLTFLEYTAGLLSQSDVPQERQLYPFIRPEQSFGLDRAGLYNQLSWLADRLNAGYYDRKYRSGTTLELPDGSRLLYHPDLNAGSAAIQYALAQLYDLEEWKRAASDAGLYAAYTAYFGVPAADEAPTVPADLVQPQFSLPFRPGEIWRFTGGFHGGWGRGSAWAALDFTPPDEISYGLCYTTGFPTTAVARGRITRLGEGLAVTDLDEDGNEGTGWTILYLHIVVDESLQLGQIIEAGEVLGYAACGGGYSTATHLHIARRYNGEWIPADCVHCPPSLTAPPFVMSGWQAVGLPNQEYQGFLINQRDSRRVVAEQGRIAKINEISW